jgi:hypothetical protein
MRGGFSSVAIHCPGFPISRGIDGSISIETLDLFGASEIELASG